MIKLVACDLDGTLLDSKKQLPKEFPEVINEFKKRGIYFVVASGRSYAGLKEMFADYIDDLVFICDNGAFVMYKGERLVLKLLKKEDVNELVMFTRDMDGLILLCGMNGTYHKSADSKAANDEIATYYTNRVIVEDDLNIEDDIFKVAIYDKQNSEEHSYPELLKRYGERYNGQTSGERWMDVMTGGTNKGTALKDILAKLEVGFDEAAAFGDYMNDYELLENAYYSFAMANAHEKIKELARYQTASNDENGVVKAIYEYVL